MDGTRRARTRWATALAVVFGVAATLVVPAAAVTPMIETDVAAFESRASAWTQAREAYRENAREQALTLATDARQAEADRLAVEEAARVAAAERKVAEEAAARTTTTTTTTTTVAPTTTVSPTAPNASTTTTTVAPVTGDPTAAQWQVLRQCESSGNYSIVSSNGRYRGAYQFSQPTWDWIAGLDHPMLVGTDPAAAAPGDQDAMALALWRRRGWSPWPICGAQAAAV